MDGTPKIPRTMAFEIRVQEIVRRVRRGEDPKALAAEYGLTLQWLRGILGRHYWHEGHNAGMAKYSAVR